MGIEKGRKGLVEDLIEKAGGCAVVDGGFATQLEKHGAAINDSLWSAVCLIKDPDLIKLVHMEYLEAGADILVTSSYQATIPGFLSRGLSIEESELLLKKSVKLAVDARDKFWDAKNRISGHGYNRALVAASIGSDGERSSEHEDLLRRSNCFAGTLLDARGGMNRRRYNIVVRLRRRKLRVMKMKKQRKKSFWYVFVVCVEKFQRAAKARLPAGCPPERKEYRPKSYSSDTMKDKLIEREGERAK